MFDNSDDAPGRTNRAVAITGMAVTTGYGHGIDALRAGIWSGEPAFVPVTRFDTSRYEVGVAAEAPGALDLDSELITLTEEALQQAGLSETERADAPLVMARHADPAVSRLPREEQESRPISETARWLSRELGLGGAGRTYINACVAASTAIAEAAALISSGRNDRVVVAAGHLVDAESFTTFTPPQRRLPRCSATTSRTATRPAGPSPAAPGRSSPTAPRPCARPAPPARTPGSSAARRAGPTTRCRPGSSR